MHPVPLVASSPVAASRDRSPLAILADAWLAYRTHRIHARNAAVVQGLDDRTLHDLGLARSEIEAVVRDGRTGSPRKTPLS